VKARLRDENHRPNDELVGLSMQGKLGRLSMKTILAGIAFAIAVAFASQAFALPYCANDNWQHGHYTCTNLDE
jgi:hypothetical protein